MEALVKMEHVTKEFPGVRALDDISFDIRAGEVHVLLKKARYMRCLAKTALESLH